ncbi:endoplasmic reticulum-Golgi intermediate compartment protein 2-like [Mobula birostris]|uniref:endoplasmic reticulum-Golgi intermediate compartment protein 2-like n=1 Tax=Mobula birostris TaxID=1983395 RepID=UPI003B287A5C
MRRRFSRKISSSTIKKLDAFPKVADVCVETSITGGAVSLLTFALISALTVGEYCYYRNTWISYSYQVDTDTSSKLQVNIDITVAMKCDYIGADITEQLDRHVHGLEDFQYEPTNFELSAKDRVWQRKMKDINRQLQMEHKLLDSLIKSSFNWTAPAEGPKDVDSIDPPNACRIHGSTEVSKVSGNFHILAGRSHQLPLGHAHVLSVKNLEVYNFSHRINHFSFGMPSPGLIHPLDGSEKITDSRLYMFRYFLIVVPTEINTYKFSTSTYQYSVSEQEKIMAGMGRKGEMPGILVKYDISCLKILISEEGMSTYQLLIRICGVAGGIFSTADMNEITSVKEHRHYNHDLSVVVFENTNWGNNFEWSARGAG